MSATVPDRRVREDVRRLREDIAPFLNAGERAVVLRAAAALDALPAEPAIGETGPLLRSAHEALTLLREVRTLDVTKEHDGPAEEGLGCWGCKSDQACDFGDWLDRVDALLESKPVADALPAEDDEREPWRDAEGHPWEYEHDVKCVVCPGCAFTFAAYHGDHDGGYSCPACAEASAGYVPSDDTATVEQIAHEMVETFTDRGSIGSIDSHLRSSWQSRRRVEGWRAALAAARSGEPERAPTADEGER